MTFRAQLGRTEKLVTVLVGIGVFLGLPLVLGIAFAVSFREPKHLLLPASFAAIFGIIYAFRPLAFTLGARELAVERPLGAWTLPYARIRAVRTDVRLPSSFTIGLFRVQGFFGSYGIYWSRAWGVFRVFVTDSRKLVELELDDGSRVMLSPHEPSAFREALLARARESGVEIA